MPGLKKMGGTLIGPLHSINAGTSYILPWSPLYANVFRKTITKLHTRWYRTLAVMWKNLPGASDCCWRCREGQGTLYKKCWSCPKPKQYWLEVKKITSYRFSIARKCWFFSYSIAVKFLLKHKKSIVRHMLNVAKTCITLCWKESNPHSIAMWLNKVRNKQERAK